MSVRIVSLNIRHGGGKRIAGLADWLVTKNPSAVVLSEWQNNVSGQQIKERLKDRGFQTAATSKPTNGVLMAGTDLVRSEDVTPSDSTAGNLLMIELKQKIKILGCYFPQKRAQEPFFQQCIQLAQKQPDIPLVIVGDLNTGNNDLDIEGSGAPFHCADLFEALTNKAGLVDLWRSRHGDQQEWTWRSPKNGFRIDHVFGNEAFINRFPAFRCEIDHVPRDSRLTDHSAVVLDGD